MTLEPDLGDRPIEDDPTGMRALLRSLPDPGPMPGTLVARIQASLAAEVEARAGGLEASAVAEPAHPQAAGATPQDVPVLAARRARRVGSPGKWLVAAVAAGVVALGGVGLITSGLFDGSDTTASGFTAADAEKSSPEVAAGGGEFSSSSSGRASGSADPAAGATVRVTMTQTSYAAAGLADQARAYLQRSWPMIGPNVPGSPGAGPIATPLGARACADALGLDPAEPVTVDLGTFAGDPAALVVGAGGGGARTAYVVERTCTTGSTATLSGPVILP